MTMPEELSFLQAIQDEPGNFDLWSIYTDWLEERNDPRAPLFRRHVMGALGMRFAFVPKGTFWMSEDGKNAQRQVEIEQDFYVGIYPVTQGEWGAVMGKNPSYFSRKGGGKDEVRDISDDDLKRFPVEQVSWDDVQKFLERLNEREDENKLLYRLPSEAEWEYTCRGGAVSKEACSFDFYFSNPTNDLSSEQANFNGNYPAGKASTGPYLKRPTKVGSYEPNPLGLYDFHGNVWEWCQDEWGSNRVIRGGGWGSRGGGGCLASDRDGFRPGSSDGGLAVPSSEQARKSE